MTDPVFSRRRSSDGAKDTKPLQFCLFGPLAITTPTRRISVTDFPSRKAKQACELIVGALGRPVSKDVLIESLWGDRLPRNPGAAVDHTMSLLRQVVRADDGSQPILTERGRYRIDLSVADIDILQFDVLVDRASSEHSLSSLPTLLAAVDLAQGPVLEDEMYTPWAEDLRECYRQRVQRVQLDLARAALADDQAGLAVRMAERARRQTPEVLEEAYGLNISGLVQLGRRHDARVLLAELEHRMVSEFGTDLSPETAILRSMLRNVDQSSRSALVATTVRGTLDALPVITREAELSTINAAMARANAGSSELVIVQGPGGIGKSHLLAAVASVPGRVVRSFGCLPSDSDYPLYVAHRLMRSLANESGLAPPPPAETVPVSFDRLAAIIDGIGPTILIIDDLQRADEASVAVLTGLARPHSVHSVLVLASRRLPDPGTAVDRRSDVIDGAQVVIDLGPLPRRAVEALPLESAWEETGGHPGLLVACVDGIRNGGHLSPAAIADVLSWVDEGGASARTVLGAAARLPSAFQAHTLALMLGLSPSTTTDMLAQCERVNLVDRVIRAEADVFAFRSELLRRVVRLTDSTWA